MQLPEKLQAAIDRLVEHTSQTSLRKARELLSSLYKERRSSPFDEEANLLAYLGARLPATFAAVYQVLQNVSLKGHLLDLGAGPGTASWAAIELFPELEKITLIEKSPKAVSLGNQLFSNHPTLAKAEWLQQPLSGLIPKADAAIFSYVLGELSDPLTLVKRVWDVAPLLILIEPGTPKGFELIRYLRKEMIHLGAFIAAPCPHADACPIQGKDWCHFSARIERSRLHRALKEGSLGYEDEKFSYAILSKFPVAPTGDRIIRRPEKQSGYVKLRLCTRQGVLEDRIVSRKEKEIYRKARDAEWGGLMDNETK